MLERFQASLDLSSIDIDSRKRLFALDPPDDNPNHAGGKLIFGADGFLHGRVDWCARIGHGAQPFHVGVVGRALAGLYSLDDSCDGNCERVGWYPIFSCPALCRGTDRRRTFDRLSDRVLQNERLER